MNRIFILSSFSFWQAVADWRTVLLLGLAPRSGEVSRSTRAPRTTRHVCCSLLSQCFTLTKNEHVFAHSTHTADSNQQSYTVRESESGGRLRGRGAPMPHESQGRSSLGTPRRQRLLPVALCSHRPYCLPLTIPSSRWRCSHSRCCFAAASADVPGPPVEGRAVASVRQNHFVLKQNSPQSSSGSQVH